LSEVVIAIDTLNPVEFFGVNDTNLDVIRKKFPELKLISRGSR
jgi:phosphate starvation-inducible PhoH-like protein